jgi:hypothetical protein
MPSEKNIKYYRGRIVSLRQVVRTNKDFAVCHRPTYRTAKSDIRSTAMLSKVLLQGARDVRTVSSYNILFLLVSLMNTDFDHEEINDSCL